MIVGQEGAAMASNGCGQTIDCLPDLTVHPPSAVIWSKNAIVWCSVLHLLNQCPAGCTYLGMSSSLV